MEVKRYLMGEGEIWIITMLCRRGQGGPEAQEKFHEDLGAEKSFIQYDEYFLSLARYQAELESNPNIPVTEL